MTSCFPGMWVWKYNFIPDKEGHTMICRVINSPRVKCYKVHKLLDILTCFWGFKCQELPFCNTSCILCWTVYREFYRLAENQRNAVRNRILKSRLAVLTKRSSDMDNPKYHINLSTFWPIFPPGNHHLRMRRNESIKGKAWQTGIL